MHLARWTVCALRANFRISRRRCGGDERTLEVVESAEDHITVRIPSDLAGDEGDEVTITVSGRCGDAEAGAQVKSIAANLA